MTLRQRSIFQASSTHSNALARRSCLRNHVMQAPPYADPTTPRHAVLHSRHHPQGLYARSCSPGAGVLLKILVRGPRVQPKPLSRRDVVRRGDGLDRRAGAGERPSAARAAQCTAVPARLRASIVQGGARPRRERASPPPSVGPAPVALGCRQLHGTARLLSVLASMVPSSPAERRRTP